MNLDQLRAEFARFGETDEAYLAFHFRRFEVTRALFRARFGAPKPGAALLDLGAHWLHQALLYADDGFAVTAVDLPLTFSRPSVRDLAASRGIDLVECDNLANPEALDAVAEDSVDVILMTEILEHLAFNPLALWRQLYRVLKRGGRIVISTPNYYALRSLIPKTIRFALLRGGGLAHQSVLTQETFAHHWKEYSAKELKDYFKMLSPDFRLTRSVHVRDYYPTRSRWARPARALEWALPLLRPNLHIEIDLVKKDQGIVLSPGWST